MQNVKAPLIKYENICIYLRKLQIKNKIPMKKLLVFLRWFWI